ncbi:DsbC family protein [Hydrogenovibrio marinus]|uniref:Thiol:disulfide interchange protein n=1 Tax=Hydrogenovibrio marinus TaxID=28885 RepID=A0A066ZMM0_HYDMR|nr:DsbC family protein [Hydrogenovibrio marinus]KDN94727.1 hypothetical protein EI16_12590 [Hydrogenovibrio marinus]
MKKLLLALTIGLISTATLAGDKISLKESLQKKFPATPITSATFVKGIPGLVELVVAKNRILYTNESGDKIIVGHIYDPRTNVDLTQTRINDLTRVDFSKLPFKDSFTVTKGKGTREFAVFTDPECPFCHKLDNELQKLTDYKMHVFMFPLSIHPGSKALSKQIWCSNNKGKAFESWMEKGTKPSSGKCDASAIDRNVKFGMVNGISGTPAIIGKNGIVNSGWLPAKRLDSFLNQTSAPKLSKKK